MNARSTTEYLIKIIEESKPKVVLFQGDPKFKMIDWKLNGCFSKLIQQGIITGAYSEVTLAPVLWNGKQLKFFIIGMGDRKEPDAHLKGLGSGL